MTDKRSRKIQRYGSALDVHDATRRDPLGGIRQAVVAPKRRCCKKKTRCRDCPVVVNTLQRAVYDGVVDTDALNAMSERLRRGA